MEISAADIANRSLKNVIAGRPRNLSQPDCVYIVSKTESVTVSICPVQTNSVLHPASAIAAVSIASNCSPVRDPIE